MNSEFSFYQFSQTIESGSDYCDIALSVCFGSDIAFFVEEAIVGISYCTMSGDVIKSATNVGSGMFVKLTDDLSEILANGDCFRIKVNNYFSNIFRYVSGDETSLLEYRCNESQFGFNYNATEEKNKVRLPIRLYNPKYPQDEKVYIKSTGDRKVLYAKIDKEWNLETEYMPELIHEKIIVALSHDLVLIDGEKVTKSDTYEIDWENYIDGDCAGKLAKATCKVQQNKTLRNSNQ